MTLAALQGLALPLVSEGWTLVCFFKSECPTSPLVLPYVERIYQRYAKAPGFQVLGISQDPREATETFARETGVTFPISLDEGWTASRAFDLVAVPSLFLLDETGRVLDAQAGLNKAWLNDLAARIAGRLGETAVEVAPPDDGQPSFRPG